MDNLAITLSGVKVGNPRNDGVFLGAGVLRKLSDMSPTKEAKQRRNFDVQLHYGKRHTQSSIPERTVEDGHFHPLLTKMRLGSGNMLRAPEYMYFVSGTCFDKQWLVKVTEENNKSIKIEK